MAEVSFNGTIIHYNVEYKKKKKNVTIYVSAENGVKVTAPKRMKDNQIREIIIEKADWIVKKLAQMAERAQKIKPRLYKDGETLLLLGKAYPLHLRYVQSSKKPKLEFRQETFTLTLPPAYETDENNTVLTDICTTWYKKAGKEIIEERVHYFSSIMKLTPAKVTVKEQKKRWGTCTSKGHLHFNWKLTMAPIEVIDYVVVHELAHLKHFNHSPEFWGFVNSIMPDYKQKKEWLKHNGILLNL